MHPFLRKYLSSLMLTATLSSALGKTPDEKVWFVDTDHIYRDGSALSMEYLAQKAPEFSELLHQKLQPWVVRIQVIHSATDSGTQTNHGTGTILEGGKVITAKHVITANVSDPESIKILLTTIDGRTFPATVVTKGASDWAELQMDLTAKDSAMKHSPIQLATPIVGETAVFLGYPAQRGLDSDGNVQAFQAADCNHQTLASALVPMPIVCSVKALNELKLATLAGFPAVGGMSGGPVFNLHGQVIAVQKSIAVTTNDETGEVLRYELNGEASDTLNISVEDPSSH